MGPKYTLNPVLENPAIEPGDSIKIQLYISGWGAVNQNKLLIQYLSTELIDPDNPGTVGFSIKYAHDPDTWSLERMSPVEYMESEGTEGVPIIGEEMETGKLDSRGMIFNLGPEYFMASTEWTAPEGEYPPRPQTDHPELLNEYILPALTTETTPEDYPPIELVLNTQDCPPGDYVIRFIFTYTDESGDIYQETEEIQIHVKSHREILEPFPTIAGIIAVGIALISLAWQISSVLGKAVLLLVFAATVFYLYQIRNNLEILQ